jgi:hypothetical protein
LIPATNKYQKIPQLLELPSITPPVEKRDPIPQLLELPSIPSTPKRATGPLLNISQIPISVSHPSNPVTKTSSTKPCTTVPKTSTKQLVPSTCKIIQIKTIKRPSRSPIRHPIDPLPEPYKIPLKKTKITHTEPKFITLLTPEDLRNKLAQKPGQKILIKLLPKQQ